MKRKLTLLFVMACVLTGIAFAQPTYRTDAVWARTVPAGTITLDGNLNEPAWAKAETIVLNYGMPGSLPTSGYCPEFQADAITDSTHATVKFLVQGNQLFLGFFIPDSSIGGTQDWARWDAILMSVKNRLVASRPAEAAEYFYTYWNAGLANPAPVVGAKPRFVGKFGNFNDTTRTDAQRAAWDARCVIKGTSNDAGRDTSWTVEMKVDLSVLGYDVTKASGDCVEVCFSIWDCDYLFEGNAQKINTTRTHWQSPWGNANANNVGRVYARPDVTINTTILPTMEPDVLMPNMAASAAPTIDGNLNEAVWNNAYSFQIGFGDTLLRQSYPGVGKDMSGQYQPQLNGNPLAPVLDPSHATVKMFVKDKYLYVGVDANDQVIQGTEVFDKCDGFGITIGDRQSVNTEHVMNFRYLRLAYGANGIMQPYDYMSTLIDSNGVQWKSKLKGTSTVNNNTDVDEGYTIEMRIDLTKLGYDANLTDRLLFMGAVLCDGDSFDDSLANYGTRTWWYREHAGGPAAAYVVLNPSTDVNDGSLSYVPETIKLIGNYPNPFNPSTKIRFSVAKPGEVNLVVFNSLGQKVASQHLSANSIGVQEYNFNASNLASGVYFYRIELKSNSTLYSSQTGKMLLVK